VSLPHIPLVLLSRNSAACTLLHELKMRDRHCSEKVEVQKARKVQDRAQDLGRCRSRPAMSRVRVSCANRHHLGQVLTLHRELASDVFDEPIVEETVGANETIEQEPAILKSSRTKEPVAQQESHNVHGFGPRDEELAWAVGHLMQQQEAWAGLNAKPRQ